MQQRVVRPRCGKRALEAAVAEAWAYVEAGRVTPHAQARAELMDFIALARRRIAELDGQSVRSGQARLSTDGRRPPLPCEGERHALLLRVAGVGRPTDL